MIQVICNQLNSRFVSEKIQISKFDKIRSLDEFDINFIYLTSEDIWQSPGDIYLYDSFRIKDINLVNSMICNSKKAKNVIVLPQDIMLKQGTKTDRLSHSIDVLENVVKNAYHFFSAMIEYENTKTQLGDLKVDAAFYFIGGEKIIKSEKSEKCTVIKCGDVYLTTLDIDSKEKINAFIQNVFNASTKEPCPEWLMDFKMFDDEELERIIEEQKRVIANAQEKIDNAKKRQDDNIELKSILHTNGDELVTVVFKILEDIFNIDLKDFIDERKEDFRFEYNGNVYIGEIKGVTSNVKNENVSQLGVHVSNYMDNNPDKDINTIKSMLIMDYQRNIEIGKRDKIHINAETIAKRNGNLIIGTYELLKLYEKFKMGKWTREECIKKFDEIGILIID